MSRGKTKRRWRLPRPRMSLAALLALVAGVGGPVGWYSYNVLGQRQSARAILDAGGAVAYDWEWVPGASAYRTNGQELAGWRRIVANRLGHDAAASVVAASLARIPGPDGRGATDEHIKLLRPLRSLKSLELGAFAVTEEGAAPIAGLKQLQTFAVDDPWGKSELGPILSRFGERSRLERIFLHNTALDDEDFGAISRLPLLETLKIVGGTGQIGDAGMAKLAGLDRLKHLVLPRTRITSEGLKSIGRIKSLESLIIEGSLIDDLAPLHQLSMLRHLSLGDCRADGEALSVLGAMPALKAISLRSNSLTDAGLARLRNAPALEELELQSDSITPEGLEPISNIKTLLRIQIRGSKVLPGGSPSSPGHTSASPAD